MLCEKIGSYKDLNVKTNPKLFNDIVNRDF